MVAGEPGDEAADDGAGMKSAAAITAKIFRNPTEEKGMLEEEIQLLHDDDGHPELITNRTKRLAVLAR